MIRRIPDLFNWYLPCLYN